MLSKAVPPQQLKNKYRTDERDSAILPECILNIAPPAFVPGRLFLRPHIRGCPRGCCCSRIGERSQRQISSLRQMTTQTRLQLPIQPIRRRRILRVQPGKDVCGTTTSIDTNLYLSSIVGESRYFPRHRQTTWDVCSGRSVEDEQLPNFCSWKKAES